MARGRGLGTVESAKAVLAAHAPISFVIDATAFVNRVLDLAWRTRVS
jgi:hypothetical protein